MSDRKRIFKIAGVYTAVILGAGFASGQELLSFFVCYGFYGFLGILVSGGVFAFVGWGTLTICMNKNVNTYEDFINLIMGKRLGIIMHIATSVFLFILFATMLAAGGASFKETFNLPYAFGVIVMALLCFITLMFDLDGFVEINSILAPIMVIGGIFIALYSFCFQMTPTFSQTGVGAKDNWLFSAIVYASYNMVTAVTVLVSLKSLVKNKRVAFWGGCAGGLVMTILALCISLPLLASYDSVVGFEIPMLHIVNKNGLLLEYLYLLIMLAAIYSTAVANLFSFVEVIHCKFDINKTLLKLGVSIGGVLVAQIGFSTFVGVIYPLFGIFGLIEIILITIAFLNIRKKYKS